MRRITSRIGFAVGSMAFCLSAHALSFRAYLSVDGLDTNPCTIAQPCRLLPAALNAIVDGGEVWMLDSANFNVSPVNITKSVSILAVPGAVGSLVANGGAAVNIATGGVSVSLRNLVIVPFPGGGGTSGIQMSNGNSLTIHETLIASLPSNGVDVSASPGTRIKIMDSVIRNNYNGVVLTNGAIADISNSKITGNLNIGVYVLGNAVDTSTSLAVSDSVISSNFIGLNAFANTAGATARWTAVRTTASHNEYGFACQTFSGSALCTVGSSMASGNSINGFYQFGAGAVLRSLGNNIVIDNPVNTSGTITPVAGI